MMSLWELRKYAIDRRVEIKFGDQHHARECVISERGQVKIPGEDKDFRIEDVLDASDYFVIVANGESQQLTREAMTKAVTEASGNNKQGAVEEEE